MSSRLLEIDLARACTDLLQLDGWRALRTDPVSDDRRGKGFGEIGMADYLYIRYQQITDGAHGGALAEVLWIEWKIPAGRVAPKQRWWKEREQARGGLCLIAGIDFHASIEGFARWYGQSGLQRKNVRIGGDKETAL